MTDVTRNTGERASDSVRPYDSAASRTGTSRRAIIGAIGLAPFIGIAMAGAAHPSDGVSPQLAALIAAARGASARATAYDADVLEPARQRWLELCDRIGHSEFVGTLPDQSTYDGGPAIWSTADTHRVKRARRAVTEKVVFDGPGADSARAHYERLYRLAELADARDARIEAARRVSGLSHAYDQMERLEEACCAADKAVDMHPVASFADVIAKLDHLEQTDALVGEPSALLIAADLRRLVALSAGREA